MSDSNTKDIANRKNSSSNVLPTSNLFDTALQNVSEAQKKDLVEKAAEAALEIQKDRATRHVKSEIANNDMDDFIDNFGKAQSGAKRAVYTAKGDFETGSGRVQMNVKKSECFVATAVYGDPDLYQVEMLRTFRDSYLLKRTWGQLFVQFYYKTGPYLASFVKEKPRLKSLVKNVLDRVVNRISIYY